MKPMRKRNNTLLYSKLLPFVVLLLFFTSCHSSTDAKQQSLTDNHYQSSADTLPLPFTLHYAREAQWVNKVSTSTDNHWFDLVYPQYNARIYCSYLPVKNNLRELNDDVYRFLYRHTVVATNITETPYSQKQNNTYGMLFEIEGPVASPLQFMITDSLHHFLRGSLYFNEKSAEQVDPEILVKLKKDLQHILLTTQWK